MIGNALLWKPFILTIGAADQLGLLFSNTHMLSLGVGNTMPKERFVPIRAPAIASR